jgi:trimeric autotransporter adhesin
VFGAGKAPGTSATVLTVVASMRRALAAILLLLCLPQIEGAALAADRAPRGSLSLLDARTGALVARVDADGAVVAAIADGRGGWFVGGSFTRLGGRRRIALAHVLRDGSVDPSWRASIGSASGRPVAVYALACAGLRLFVAGAFGRVGGLQRPGLAAVDARTGAVLRTWAPSPLVWLDVGALAVAGPRLLVAGQFGYPAPGIAALDARSGALDRHWKARLRLIPDAGSFNSLLVRGSRVYVAGSFHVARLPRNGLVALAARSGRPDPRFAPRVANCSVCRGFAIVYGLAASHTRIYISGAFHRIDGLARYGVAALDSHTGAVDRSWKPAAGGSDVVRLALAGSRLYLGGLHRLVALDARTGARLHLGRVPRPREVVALAVSGGRLLVAGRG